MWVNGWLRPRLGRFPPGSDLVPIVHEVGWTSGTIWMSAENVAATGIRFPDRPARSSVALATTLSRPNAEYTASNDRDQRIRKIGM